MVAKLAKFQTFQGFHAVQGFVSAVFRPRERRTPIEPRSWNIWNPWNPWNLCFKLRRMADNTTKGVSRRDLLKRAGLAGAALTIPVTAISASIENQAKPATPAAAPRREPIENLTAAEADLLEAICARIIPTDANGPGAREARAAHYIDRALGGALSGSKQAYTAGLAAFDAYCRSSRRAPFTELSTRDQDSVLIDVETGAATGFTGSSAVFFAMVRTHTLQGTFGDPYYGGNYNFIGWDMIGYPGVRTNVR